MCTPLSPADDNVELFSIVYSNVRDRACCVFMHDIGGTALSTVQTEGKRHAPGVSSRAVLEPVLMAISGSGEDLGGLGSLAGAAAACSSLDPALAKSIQELHQPGGA